MAVEVEGEEDVGDERGHTVPQEEVPQEEVHIIKPNLDDDQDDNGDHSAVEAGGSWQPEAG